MICDAASSSMVLPRQIGPVSGPIKSGYTPNFPLIFSTACAKTRALWTDQISEPSWPALIRLNNAHIDAEDFDHVRRYDLTASTRLPHGTASTAQARPNDVAPVTNMFARRRGIHIDV